MKKQPGEAVFAILLLAMVSSAERVGVVVDNGKGGITTGCYDIATDSMADFICAKSGFDCVNFGGTLGYGMCGISEDGCPSSNCFCSNSFWGFSTKKGGGWRFSYNDGMSQVPVSDSMVMGFRWTENWGETPSESPSFCDICECGKEEGDGDKRMRIFKALGITMSPKVPSLGEPVKLKIADNITGRPVRGADIQVFEGQIGVTTPLAALQSNQSGECGFVLNKTGEYMLSVTGTEYPHVYVQINVTRATTMPETTIVTSTSTTSTTLPRHFLFDMTTSTQPSTTTTQTMPDEGLRMSDEEPDPQSRYEPGWVERLLKWLSGIF
jgi:hypothetical protein